MSDAKTLLLVDDEEAVRTSLSEILMELGYRVRAASDGFSALSEIRNQVPDIILSDLNMPGMSGFEFLSVVRCRYPAVRVVAMSGSFSGEGVPPGVAADAFYEKGVGLTFLLQILQTMTSAKRTPSREPSYETDCAHQSNLIHCAMDRSVISPQPAVQRPGMRTPTNPEAPDSEFPESNE